MEARNIDWSHISKTLAYKDDPESKAQRQKIWKLTDVNGNGYVSLAEVDKALRDVLNLDQVFNCKRAIMRAFQAAKNSKASKNRYGPDYIEKAEFKYLLYSLRQYFEYYQAFGRIDTGDDNRVDINEFKSALPVIQKWVGPIANPDEEFHKIDKNGGGQVLFDEFVSWAFSRNLDLEDDDE